MNTANTLIPASAIGAWCMQDPILDWLELYGFAKGFVADDRRPDYEPRTDMSVFLREKGLGFQAAVLRCLEEKFQVVRIAESSDDAHNLDLAERTILAMEEGVEIIYLGVLHDPLHGTCAVPDLLVRSDVLNRLADHPAIRESEILIEGKPHYRVVDIKFTTLGLSAAEMLGNDESDRRRKAQLLICNRALGRVQGYEPPTAYVIGRGYKYTKKGQKFRGDGCFDRLGPADMRDPALASMLDTALAWARRVREEGAAWEVLPRPSVLELHPNMSNTRDAPWHNAKREIAEEIGELTLLWQVSPARRPNAHAVGVTSYKDPACFATIFDLPDGYMMKLDHILNTNRDACQDAIRPDRVAANESEWRIPRGLEFFVDFETVTDLNDDFSAIPKKGGQTLIYMIGCGHMENGEWRFTAFTCDRLTESCEREIIDNWLAHMRQVTDRIWPHGHPLVFHWSHAEKSTLDTAYNSARKRHDIDWPDLEWYDLLMKVVREEPVTVKGAFAFGLKAVAKAMHRNGLIPTEWTNGPADGLGAMVGAWRCDDEAGRAGCSMPDLPLMQSIESYNEVDCRAMHEILSYLRANH